VLDASRAVGVVGKLISAEHRADYAFANEREQQRDRARHEANQAERQLVPLDAARVRRTPIVWRAEDVAVPSFTGVRVLDDVPLSELTPYIDWTPFFATWELRGVYPKILDDQRLGARAKELFKDAQALLGEIVGKKLLRARGVYGFFPAAGAGDDIEIYTDQSRSERLKVFHTLRQQGERGAGQPLVALSDFVAPRETGLGDYVGGFVVTAGVGLEELCARFEREHDDYNSIMAKALADRLAEAFAEWLHRRAREDWGYGRNENLSPEDLIRERYRGIRPAPGYPACPDHTEKRTLFDLLGAEAAVGVTLTESCAMWPASSVSGLYFAHPEARYFTLGKIGRDQVEDYARRKAMTVDEVERWLAPNLGYEQAMVKGE
jgi:5-methyltetrahydrofolate--homocysteine methyltransferase